MEIKQYAPVIIPTLNRFDHFKRCLESLEKCTGAEHTDVYVALDYPPSEKYIDGWKKIGAYLVEKEKNNSFAKLCVTRRERNYGVGHENSNGAALIKEIKPLYEFYIFTEDDNEFSLCFLEYMNACFQRFIDDDRIVKICGYNFPMEFPSMYKNNFYISKRFCAWGNGSWIKKNKNIEDNYYNLDALRNIILDDTKYNKLKKVYPRGIDLIHSMLKLGKLHGDAIYEIYANLEDKYFVLPTISKVRNYGNDGTGVHSLRMNIAVNDLYSKQLIDQSVVFDFTDDLFTYEPIGLIDNNYVVKTTLRSIYKHLVIKFDFWLLRHFGFIPKSKYI
ncbi:glycosyltransferase family 2 protein [uncultured Alistipes sp.]|uniref:glycosyltransferase family 2 protein n=1 Tax=uncultured Alistipes sp. TaxID=538949 RepID=UPI0025F110AF|nr:glycosyltransferase family A protein [uncultured Alistipes sp.]